MDIMKIAEDLGEDIGALMDEGYDADTAIKIAAASAKGNKKAIVKVLESILNGVRGGARYVGSTVKRHPYRYGAAGAGALGALGGAFYGAKKVAPTAERLVRGAVSRIRGGSKAARTRALLEKILLGAGGAGAAGAGAYYLTRHNKRRR